MSINFKVCPDDSTYHSELNRAGNKLVIVDFTSERCGPCQHIAPAFAEMAGRYPNANFLKVDTQHCPGAAQSQGVTATPTFIFFRNKTKLDSIRGADVQALEAKVRQHYGDGDDEEIEDCGVPGHMDLIPMVNKSDCECLNESDDHNFTQGLSPGAGYLESDADEQLIMYISFNQAVKLHSLRIKGPLENGPLNIRIFINQPYTLDFDAAESATAVQDITLTSKDLSGEIIPLKYVRYQNVMNLAVFVKDNQSGTETTRVDYFQIIGSPVQTTNMSDFKRIAGKKGESH